VKKRMIALALSSIFGLGAALAAPQTQDPAQEPNTAPQANHERHRPDPNHEVQMLAKRLNLTPDQQSQILPILTARQQQMESIWKDSSLSKKDRHEKMVAVREQSDSQLKAVLNDTQKAQYDQLRQQQRERMQQHRQEKQNDGTQGTSSNS
jgi:periplasmic protein CpxP/Spy